MKEQQGPGFDTMPRGQVMAFPRRFGNYDLERRIDVGGMGEVYLARQRSAFDRQVAIKIIRSDLVHDMTARRRFLREAEVNAHIKHEHILALYEFGEEQGRLFLVTPYIAGGTLSRRLHKGHMTLSEVYQIFTALVKAVAYIHRRGVIHRDLKPSNILLDHEESRDGFSSSDDRIYVRLIDFGIATIQGAAASPPLTTAGTEMGTVAYMAPERMSGIAAPSNDIFSLGIILHQMLTGHMPDDEPKPDSINRYLSAPLAYVVNRSIAPRIDERFSSAEELLQAFEKAYQSLITPSVEASPPNGQTGLQHPLDVTAGRIETVTHRRTARVERAMDAFSPAESANYTNGSSASEGQMASRIDKRSPVPQRPKTFVENDYGAPTVNFEVPSLDAQESFDDFSPLARKQSTSQIPLKSQKLSRTKKQRNPIVAIITLLIVIVLIVMAGLFYFEFQPFIAPTATINLGPNVQTIQTIFQISAQPSQQSSNLATASIPASLLNKNSTTSLQGPATGQTCFLGVFNCQKTVQESDVNSVAVQLRQNLQAQIATYLQQQLQIHKGSPIGTTQFADVAINATPPVGSASSNVTVSLTEQGSINYYSTTDAQQLARQLLQQQVQKLGPNYVLLNSSVEIGPPAITGVSNTSIILSIAAGGNVQYSLTPAILHDIANHVKGMKLEAAQVYIKQQPGIEPASVSIHLSSGDTMPGNTQQITIIPTNPITIPRFNLPTVTPISVTPTTAPTTTP